MLPTGNRTFLPWQHKLILSYPAHSFQHISMNISILSGTEQGLEWQASMRTMSRDYGLRSTILQLLSAELLNRVNLSSLLTTDSFCFHESHRQFSGIWPNGWRKLSVGAFKLWKLSVRDLKGFSFSIFWASWTLKMENFLRFAQISISFDPKLPHFLTERFWRKICLTDRNWF